MTIIFLLMSVPSLSPVRKVRVFIPPNDSPLLTTYTRSLLPKIHPMKQKYQIYSKLQQTPSQQNNPQTILMSARQLDCVNNVYRKIKRSRGQKVWPKQTEFVRDPLYRSLYDMKRKSVQFHERSFTKQERMLGSSNRDRVTKLAKQEMWE